MLLFSNEVFLEWHSSAVVRERDKIKEQNAVIIIGVAGNMKSINEFNAYFAIAKPNATFVIKLFRK